MLLKVATPKRPRYGTSAQASIRQSPLSGHRKHLEATVAPRSVASRVSQQEVDPDPHRNDHDERDLADSDSPSQAPGPAADEEIKETRHPAHECLPPDSVHAREGSVLNVAKQ